MRYLLTPRAEDHLTALLYDLAEHAGWNRSMDVEETLYKAFQALGANPGIGHKRDDLTDLPVYFYFADPYQILYLRETRPLSIVAIFHGSRDIKALLAHVFE